MATADYTIRQGDTAPSLSQQLTYTDGTLVNLTGTTVTLIMRSLTAAAPLALTGTYSTGTDPTQGIVTYTPSAQDTSTPGSYMATWQVMFAAGQQMTFPTVGYLSIEIEPSLTTAGGQQLVSLPDVKDHLNITAIDRSVDLKLIRWISGVRPVIEQITGPIIPQQFEEWDSGGQTFVRLRHPPSVGYGTTPVLELLACSEYIGPIEWPLMIVPSPDKGQMYSCMLDNEMAIVVRRTAGGGTQPFPYQQQAVHTVYISGQSRVPDNVYEATLELLRVNYEQTMAVGRGSRTRADESDTGPPLGFFVPRRVRELLSPNRRHPSLA